MFTLSKAITCLLFRYLSLSFQQNPKMPYTLNGCQTLNGWVIAGFQEERKLPFTSDVSFTLPREIAYSTSMRIQPIKKDNMQCSDGLLRGKC